MITTYYGILMIGGAKARSLWEASSNTAKIGFLHTDNGGYLTQRFVFKCSSRYSALTNLKNFNTISF